MYSEYFGLESQVFSQTTDTGYFLDQGEFKDGLDVLECALYHGEGLIKITGEIGTGKTQLLRKLLSTLDKSYLPVCILNPSTDSKTLYWCLAKEIGLRVSAELDQTGLLENIQKRLKYHRDKGKRVVLLIDDAQALSDDSMEALLSLSNLESESAKLLQLVLFGLPDLDSRLRQDHLRQLHQRIVFSHRLNPLTKEATRLYIHHRLEVAGYKGGPLIDTRAVTLLHHASGGVPRLINIIAHKSMMVAFGRGDKFINSDHIRQAALDSEGTQLPQLPSWRFVPSVFVFGLLCLIPTTF